MLRSVIRLRKTMFKYLSITQALGADSMLTFHVRHAHDFQHAARIAKI